jgi:Acyltransferase C-terminus
MIEELFAEFYRKTFKFLRVFKNFEAFSITFLIPSSIQVPREDEALTKWLYERFAEKEELLETFYNTGSFGHPAEIQPTVIHQDLLRFFLIHLFFITSSYLHFQMIAMLSNQLL